MVTRRRCTALRPIRLAGALILSDYGLYIADAQPRQHDGENFPDLSDCLALGGIDALQLDHEGSGLNP